MSSNRPYLICHMITSLDGKITSGTGQNIYDDEFLDIYDFTDEKLETQGWMCGRVTMEMFAESVGTPLPSIQLEIAEDYVSPPKFSRFAVAIDTQGTLRWSSNVIKSGIGRALEFSLIVIVTEQTPKEYLSYLRTKEIAYILSGQKELDWAVALQKLHDLFGIKKLSLQGGGKINGSLLKAGFIDEVSLIMTPLAVNNSEAPAVFENQVTPETFSTYRFEVIECKQLENNVVWLRYKKLPQ
jgi:2,5-diamino-6-(ribosylamino)-4(3H)-pyrimidinone 5'-phosphate reductase